MKYSVYIPKNLEEHMRKYLEGHPGLTFSALVREAPEKKARFRHNKLTSLAGFISFQMTDGKAANERERLENEFIECGLNQR